MNSILRMIALSSVLVHLWTGCGTCSALGQCALGEGSGHHRHVAVEYYEAIVLQMALQTAQQVTLPASGCHHGCTHESPTSHHDQGTHDNDPCNDAPCDSSDHHCACCECVFVVPNVVEESRSIASEMTQPMALPSTSLLVQPELSSRPTFGVPSPEDVISDARSFRARIAVFLL